MEQGKETRDLKQCCNYLNYCNNRHNYRHKSIFVNVKNNVFLKYQFQVLQNGQIVEFDTPFKLLQNKQGHLYQMTLQTGPTEHQRLIQMAEHAFIQSRSITGS